MSYSSNPNDNGYDMEYIPNKTLYKAVMFARKMIREDTPPGLAITRAARYYQVEVSDVAHHVGRFASQCAQNRRRAWHQESVKGDSKAGDVKARSTGRLRQEAEDAVSKMVRPMPYRRAVKNAELPAE